jgi:hypothetical protein
MGLSAIASLLFLVLPLILLALQVEKRRPDWSAAKIAFWAGASLPLLVAIISLGAAAFLLEGSAGQSDGNGVAFAMLLLAALVTAVMALMGFAATWVAVARVRRR